MTDTTDVDRPAKRQRPTTLLPARYLAACGAGSIAAIEFWGWHGSDSGVVALRCTAVLAALVAAIAAAAAARRHTSSTRGSWAWLAAAWLTWAVGATWEGLTGHRPVAAQDSVGHLALVATPLFALAGVLVHPCAREQSRRVPLRLALNATAVAAALMALAWQFPGGSLLGAEPGGLPRLVAAVHLTADLVLASAAGLLVINGLGRPGTRVRWPLVGAVAVAVGDAAGCSVAADVPAAAQAFSTLLLVSGFAVAATAASDAEGPPEPPPALAGSAQGVHGGLPYLALAAAGLPLLVLWQAGRPVNGTAVVLLATAGVVVHVRTYLLLRDDDRQRSELDEARLRRSNMIDPLTGMLNHAGLLHHLETALATSEGRLGSLVCLRPVATHSTDQVPVSEMAIVDLAKRLQTGLGNEACLARIDDNTFASYLACDLEPAEGLVQELLVAVQTPTRLPERNLHLSLAAGIASTAGEAPPPSAQTLLQRAAAALHSVATVPGGTARYAPHMLEDQSAQQALHDAVIAALRGEQPGRIDVVFEPVVDMVTGAISAVSARAHWRGSETVPAGHLADLAHRAGLSQKLDDMVVETALNHFTTWASRWPAVCRQLWITVTAATLAAPDAVERLSSRLSRHGLASNTLVLESLCQQHDTDAPRDTLRQLRASGVRIAASDALVLGSPTEAEHSTDTAPEADFFDVTPLLVDRCVSDVRARHLIHATVEFATAHDAAPAARQVTTTEQHEQLCQLGVVTARGPLYGKAASAEEIETLLNAAATGIWQPQFRSVAQRRRSSRAWNDLRQVVGSLPIGAFTCNRDGYVVLAEGALFELLGLPRDPIDLPLTSLFATDSGSGDGPLGRPLRQALHGMPTVTTATVRDHRLQIHLAPHRDGAKTISAVHGIAIDVTHRWQAEQALGESERRFREVFTQAPVGIAVIDAADRLVQVNPALAAMLGHTPDEMVGRDMSSLWHSDTPRGPFQQYPDGHTGKATGLRAERTYLHRNGSPVSVRITVAAITDASVPGSTIAIVEDLSDVKQLEVELRHAQKLEAVGLLAAGIAHEINTPIQFIGDNINFLAEAFIQLTGVLFAAQPFLPDTENPEAATLNEITETADLPWLLEEVPNATRQSLDGVAKVATIVKAMRNFGHPDQREPTPVDVNSAIRDTATIAANEHKYVADLHLELGELPNVLGYPSEFHQVILNLIVNASHAVADATSDTGRRGNITLRSWADETHVHVTVQDDGCGIPPDVRERIFDPFFTTKEVGRGTGQGLTIVHNVVVDKHHGNLHVDSTPGQGTTFTIDLPRDPPAT